MIKFGFDLRAFARSTQRAGGLAGWHANSLRTPFAVAKDNARTLCGFAACAARPP
jgi:hypothetical protein